jgi:mannonate dehydratase
VHTGGITHLRKIAALAEAHSVPHRSHGATDLSPVCLAAALPFRSARA